MINNVILLFVLSGVAIGCNTCFSLKLIY